MGLNQKICVRRIDIERLDAEHVSADQEQGTEGRGVELLELNRPVVRVSRGGGGVPRHRVRRVFAGDLLPVEPGHETVVVFQAQGEPADFRRIGDHKRNPHERRTTG